MIHAWRFLGKPVVEQLVRAWRGYRRLHWLEQLIYAVVLLASPLVGSQLYQTFSRQTAVPVGPVMASMPVPTARAWEGSTPVLRAEGTLPGPSTLKISRLTAAQGGGYWVEFVGDVPRGAATLEITLDFADFKADRPEGSIVKGYIAQTIPLAGYFASLPYLPTKGDSIKVTLKAGSYDAAGVFSADETNLANYRVHYLQVQ